MESRSCVGGIGAGIRICILGFLWKSRTQEPRYLHIVPFFLTYSEYTKLNPNGRIPALVDHKRNDFVVWESGAILLYLVKHYDHEYKLWSKDDNEQSNIIEWLFFQVSGFGPYLGQAFW